MSTHDVWQTLKSANKPLLIYGMGDGADELLNVLASYDIRYEGFFASDGFVRGQLFHGMRVMSYSEACQKYDDFIVVLSFGTRLPDVIDNIKRIASRRTLIAPDLPVAGHKLFDGDFYENNKASLDSAREALADDLSRKVFDSTIAFKLSGDINHLFEPHMNTTRDMLFDFPLRAQRYRHYVDLGSYNGDTVIELLRYAPNLERITAFEPDSKNFGKLSSYLNSLSGLKTEAINAAAWDKAGELMFDSKGGRASKLGGTKLVKVLPPDEIPGGFDYCGSQLFIKYDVEGAEREAILGTAKTISELSPDLLISLYHRSEDLFALPLLIRSLNPSYSLYLRRHSYIPAWDLNLIAISSSL